ncbi:MAG: hypothetical protein OEU54_09565 [Gemmatimonadota bacterium]|nr:hypothetical protein [Gemmatimonadota bacterium]
MSPTEPVLRILTDAVAPPGRDGVAVVMYDRPALLDEDADDAGVTIILREVPPPSVSRVRYLVSSCQLRLRLHLIPRPAALDDESAPPDAIPVWPLSSSLALLAGDERIANAFVDRGGALTITAQLDRSQTLLLLDAIYDSDSHLRLEGSVSYESTDGVGRAVVGATLVHTLGGRDFAERIVLATQEPHGLVPVPGRTVSRASRRAGRSVSAPIPLARTGTTTTSISHTLGPKLPIYTTENILKASPGGYSLANLALDDLFVAPVTKPVPLVENSNAPYWRDLHDSGKSWYAPEFELVAPDAGDIADDATFAFRFRRDGVTSAGEPALRGEVSFVVQAAPSNSTTEALESDGRPDGAEQVPLVGLSGHLAIPFVDSATGDLREHRVDIALTDRGDDTWLVEAQLFGDWVRLAYGALSSPGFQASPVEISLTYRFEGAVPLGDKIMISAFGGKIAAVPVVAAAAVVKPQSVYLVREDLSVRTGSRKVASLSKEPVRATTSLTAGTVRPLALGALTVRPQVLDPPPEPVKHGSRSFARQARVDATVPCETHGHLYLDTTEEPAQAVGCTDALQLGTIRYELYRPVDGFANDRFTVERAIQEPGRFLVRPTTYRIGRRDADDPVGPYAPLVLVYAHLSPDAADATRVVFDATLLPDVTAAELAQLEHDLAATLPGEPRLEFPTQVDYDDIEWHWNLSVPDAEVTALLMPGGGIRVTVTTSVISWPLLRSQLETGGMAGQASIELPDGSEVSVGMELDLRHLVGPVNSGPVGAERDGSTVTLINHAESSMAVAACLVWSDGQLTRIPVGLTLESGASEEISIEMEGDRLLPEHRPVVGDSLVLDEVRSYVENIETTIAFVNLVNFENHDLSRLDVEARIEGLGPAKQVVFDDEGHIGEVTFVLPLTSYLVNPPLDYRVTAVDTTGVETPTPWQAWDIGRDGVVISLVWQDIESE